MADAATGGDWNEAIEARCRLRRCDERLAAARDFSSSAAVDTTFTDRRSGPCQVAPSVPDASEDERGFSSASCHSLVSLALKLTRASEAAAGKVSMGTAEAAEELLAGGGGNGMSAGL